MDSRRIQLSLSALCVLIVTVVGVAQDQDGEDRGRKRGGDFMEQGRQLENQARAIAGPWDQHQHVIESATDQIFEQNGWNSEPDRYARELLREVDQIPPWQQQQRQAVFMTSIQRRYSLSEEQKAVADRELSQIGMQIGMKHFATLAPIMMDVIRTRSKNEPFTPEQVQRWSEHLGPVLQDARGALEQVAGKISATMTEEQRKIFDADLKAALKRHDTFVQAVDRWKEGKWTPRDFGLQNDPIHANQMAELARQDAIKTSLADRKTFQDRPGDADVTVTAEDTWEKYVRHFCDYYECNDRQKSQAFGILADIRKQAVTFRQAHKDEITKAEQLSKSAETAEKRSFYGKELERKLAPIAALFEQLKVRLDTQILTTEQRARKAEPAAEQHAGSPVESRGKP